MRGRAGDLVRVEHVLDAIAGIGSIPGSGSENELDCNAEARLAIWKLLEIIGEAAKKFSSETRDAHPEIPWATVIGTRHHLVHDYFDVDTSAMCRIIRDELPALKRAFIALHAALPTA